MFHPQVEVQENEGLPRLQQREMKLKHSDIILYSILFSLPTVMIMNNWLKSLGLEDLQVLITSLFIVVPLNVLQIFVWEKLEK